MEEETYKSPFVVAAKEGNFSQVANILKNLKTITKEQCFFALFFSSLNGHKKIVKFLLEKKIDPNYVSGAYLTPLHAAAFSSKSEEIVQILLNYGAKIDPKIKITSGDETSEMEYFCSPLLVAAWKRNANIVSTLIEKGANVNSKLVANAETIAELKNSSLNADEYKKQLMYGTFAWYDLKLYNGYTPLHYAVDCKDEIITKILINNGADLNARCVNDLTPLCKACELRGSVSILKILIEAGADINSEVNNGKNILRYILKLNHSNSFGDFYDDHEKQWLERNKCFSYLLEIGANVNAWSSKPAENTLHYAARNGMVHAVHLLLKYGANANVIDREAKTPLEYSIEQLESILKIIQMNFSQTHESSDSDSDYSDSSDEEFHQQIIEERRKIRKMVREEKFRNQKHYNLANKKYIYNLWEYKRVHLQCASFNVFKDPEPFKMISQLLTRELVRLEAISVRIVQQNVKLLASSFVKPYYIQCSKELKKMKKSSIIDGVSFFDFLIADESRLQDFGKNKKIALNINRENLQILFPNYHRFLKINIQRGEKKENSSFHEEENKWDEMANFGKCSVQLKGVTHKRWIDDDCSCSDHS